MLFDLLFYTILFFSTIASVRIIKSAEALNWFYKSLKLFFLLVCLVMWLWQILLWVLPKGSKLEEAVHLPRHLWVLENVDITPNVVNEKVVYGDHDRQYFMYYPALKDGLNKNTVIFYLHGGGWCLGSPDQHRHLGKLFQEQGYTAILAAYRLVPDFTYHDLQADVDKALASSLLFLKEKGIQNPKIIIGGTSAGGNLASLLAFNETRWENLGLDRNMLQGAFSIAGVLDLDKMDHSSTLLDYTGPVEDSVYRLANPITWINPQDSFQFLCLHGNCDGLADYSNAASFCQKLEAVNANVVDFRTFDNTSHLDLGAGWYYNPAANFGQDSVLLNWIHKISSPK